MPSLESVSPPIEEQAAPADTTTQLEYWQGKAACRGTDPELFFPVGQSGVAIAHIAAAKAVCQSCDVKSECLEYALQTNQDSGIWGGLTENERRRIRRERRRSSRR